MRRWPRWSVALLVHSSSSCRSLCLSFPGGCFPPARREPLTARVGRGGGGCCSWRACALSALWGESFSPQGAAGCYRLAPLLSHSNVLVDCFPKHFAHVEFIYFLFEAVA